MNGPAAIAPLPPSAEALTLAGAMLTDVGLVRAHNEDSVAFVVPGPEAANQDSLVLVADGMGGHAAGEVASGIAAEVIRRMFYERDGAPADLLASAFATANSAILAYAQEHPECAGMGTTCTALALRDNAAWLAHVGDSRAYLLRNGALTQLSQDQTLVAKLVREGVLTEEEAARSEHQNVILQAIGTTPEVEPEIWREGLALAPGDTLILCSDGLHGLVSDAVIAATASGRDPMDACRALIARALEAGGSDNVSVGVFRVEAVEQKAQPADGATRRIRVPQGALQDDGGGGSMQTRRIAVAKGPA
jgi:PPM family protein phosphatase